MDRDVDDSEDTVDVFTPLERRQSRLVTLVRKAVRMSSQKTARRVLAYMQATQFGASDIRQMFKIVHSHVLTDYKRNFPQGAYISTKIVHDRIPDDYVLPRGPTAPFGELDFANEAMALLSREPRRRERRIAISRKILSSPSSSPVRQSTPERNKSLSPSSPTLVDRLRPATKSQTPSAEASQQLVAMEPSRRLRRKAIISREFISSPNPSPERIESQSPSSQTLVYRLRSDAKSSTPEAEAPQQLVTRRPRRRERAISREFLSPSPSPVRQSTPEGNESLLPNSPTLVDRLRPATKSQTPAAEAPQQLVPMEPNRRLRRKAIKSREFISSPSPSPERNESLSPSSQTLVNCLKPAARSPTPSAEASKQLVAMEPSRRFRRKAIISREFNSSPNPSPERIESQSPSRQTLVYRLRSDAKSSTPEAEAPQQLVTRRPRRRERAISREFLSPSPSPVRQSTPEGNESLLPNSPTLVDRLRPATKSQTPAAEAPQQLVPMEPNRRLRRKAIKSREFISSPSPSPERNESLSPSSQTLVNCLKPAARSPTPSAEASKQLVAMEPSRRFRRKAIISREFNSSPNPSPERIESQSPSRQTLVYRLRSDTKSSTPEAEAPQQLVTRRPRRRERAISREFLSPSPSPVRQSTPEGNESLLPNSPTLVDRLRPATKSQTPAAEAPQQLVPMEPNRRLRRKAIKSREFISSPSPSPERNELLLPSSPTLVDHLRSPKPAVEAPQQLVARRPRKRKAISREMPSSSSSPMTSPVHSSDLFPLSSTPVDKSCPMDWSSSAESPGTCFAKDKVSTSKRKRKLKESKANKLMRKIAEHDTSSDSSEDTLPTVSSNIAERTGQIQVPQPDLDEDLKYPKVKKLITIDKNHSKSEKESPVVSHNSLTESDKNKVHVPHSDLNNNSLAQTNNTNVTKETDRLSVLHHYLKKFRSHMEKLAVELCQNDPLKISKVVKYVIKLDRNLEDFKAFLEIKFVSLYSNDEIPVVEGSKIQKTSSKSHYLNLFRGFLQDEIYENRSMPAPSELLKDVLRITDSLEKM